MAPNPPPKLVEKPAETGFGRHAAWSCLLSNLVLPGLGTFIARRRVAGVLQLVVSQVGFILSLLWAILLVRQWIHEGSLPADITGHLWLGLLGVALFFLAWIWSLASSLEILHAGRKSSL